jgi:hypothetical protein
MISVLEDEIQRPRLPPSRSHRRDAFVCHVHFPFSPCYAGAMRYQVWRSNVAPQQSVYVLIVADRPEGPDTNWHAYVPEAIRRMGFWAGGVDGRLARLKPVYRDLLRVQGFVVLGELPHAGLLERPPRPRLRWHPLRSGRRRPISASADVSGHPKRQGQP